MLQLLQRGSKDTFEHLQEYAATLERLLSAETARLFTHETLSDMVARSRDPSLESEDPSDEFMRLRDSFPMILRGSLLPYIHGNFEMIARSIANLYLPGKALVKSDNAKEIIKRVNAAWPGTCSEEATLRLEGYAYLRHACAHTASTLGKALYDPDKVARAAEHIPGAVFAPLIGPGADLSSFNKEERFLGKVEFDASFLPEAITFHASLVERIANGVVAPAKA